MPLMPKSQTATETRLIGIWLAIAAITAALLALAMMYQRHQILSHSEEITQSYSRLLAEQIESTFISANQTLRISEVKYRESLNQQNSSPAALSAVLAKQVDGVSGLEGLWVLDQSGKIVADSLPGTLGTDLSDRSFYQTHLTAQTSQFHVSVPLVGRRTGRRQFSVSRPMRDAQGVLQGVIVGSVSQDYLESIWQSIDLGVDGSVTLLKRDGILLMRLPSIEASIGKDFKHRPLFATFLPKAGSGVYSDESAVDGIKRQFAYRSLGVNLDMVVLVGSSYAYILKPWYTLLIVSLLIWLMAVVLFGVMLRYLASEWTARLHSEQAALLGEHALEAISQGVFISGPDRKALYVNNAFEALSGYSKAELLGSSCGILQGALTQKEIVVKIRSALDARQSVYCELLNYRKNGTTFWNQLSINPIFSEMGELTHFVGVQQDITRLKAQQEVLDLTDQIFRQGHEGVTVTDAQGHILRVNSAFTVITGYSEAEVIGKNPRILSSGLHSLSFYQAMWRELASKGIWSGEIFNRHKEGSIYPEWLTISVVRDSSGSVTNYVGTFNDLTKVKAAESQVQNLSNYDPLTGLPNRLLLQDRTTKAASAALRNKEQFCMMLVSIDRFKLINETLGHHIADGVLIEISKRLVHFVRDQDTVSHHAGKEFLLLLPNTQPDGAAHLATEMLWQLAQPLRIGNHEVSITASIGIGCFPQNGEDFESLYKSVEISMNRARDSGGDTFTFYTEDMLQQVLQRDQLSKALRTAAERNELQVVYQPLADLQSGEISGMEALVRWNSPELGFMTPGQFIPLAEETGFIKGIGLWVLRQVCADLRSWNAKGFQVAHVAVNVSPVQFRDPELTEQIRLVVNEYGIDPAQLHLEVTESCLMGNTDQCEETLKALKDMGFCLSLDDFGTGYSSLSYLKRFPFDKLKIDQSFVRDIGSNSTDTAIVMVIIAMAHGLGMRVIAEGVETEAQCEIMRSNLCDEIQGYFLSKPVDAIALEGLFTNALKLPAHLLRFRKQQRTLLLVDDEPNVLASLKRLFRRDGYQILTAASGEEGLSVLAKNKVDVIMSDQRMPGMTGVEFLREAKNSHPDSIRIVLSGYTELQSVTDAINEGSIYRFLTKPWDDEQLCEQISKAFEHKELTDENVQLDMKIRTANQELVAANRHLGVVLNTTKRQIESDRNNLQIIQETLEFLPTPILGLDDEGMIAFVNAAAQQLFEKSEPLLGMALDVVLPSVDAILHSMDEGQCAELLVEGAAFELSWRTMGKNSRSRGKLITFNVQEVLA